MAPHHSPSSTPICVIVVLVQPVNYNYVLNFMTHLAANSRRMMEINNECDQLVKAYHMQSAVIKRRHKQLNE